METTMAMSNGTGTGPGQHAAGEMTITVDGAVLESSGLLDNDEHTAAAVADLVALAYRVDPIAFATNESFKKISITYHDHYFIICLSNKKIHIVKKMLTPTNREDVVAED